MTSQIILLPFAKNRNFSNFHCISIAATNIILDVVLHLEHGGITSFYIYLKVYYQVFSQKYMLFLAYFQALFRKASENDYLPSTKYQETYLKLLISYFNCP